MRARTGGGVVHVDDGVLADDPIGEKQRGLPIISSCFRSCSSPLSSSLLPLFPFNFLSLPQREPHLLLLILLLVSSFFLRLEPWDWLASFSFFFPSNFLDSLARRSFGYDHLAPPIFFNVGNEPFWCLVAPVHKEWGKMHEMQLIAPFVSFSMATVMDKTKKTTGTQRSNNRVINLPSGLSKVGVLSCECRTFSYGVGNWPTHFFYINETASLLPGFEKKIIIFFIAALIICSVTFCNLNNQEFLTLFQPMGFIYVRDLFNNSKTNKKM